jgi:hypothetical protein
LAPIWNQLSVLLREERIPVTLAALDATVHTSTAQRFDIRSFPSLRLLSRGRVYEYTGARTLEAMHAWLESRAWEAKGSGSGGKPIPSEVSALSVWRLWAQEQANDIVMLVWRKPAAVVTIALVGAMLGVLLSLVLWIAFFEPKPVVYQLASSPNTPAAPASGTAAAVTATTASTSNNAKNATEEEEEEDSPAPAAGEGGLKARSSAKSAGDAKNRS